MASGLHYYQRVGTLDSVQRDVLGTKITDPSNGRVFQYVRHSGSATPVKMVRGAPVAFRGNSAFYVSPDFTDNFPKQTAGINVNSTSSSGMYLWIMKEGFLGTDSQSDVFPSAVWARTDGNATATKAALLFVTGGSDSHGVMGSVTTPDSMHEALSQLAGDSAFGSVCESMLARTYIYRYGTGFAADSGSVLTQGFIKART